MVHEVRHTSSSRALKQHMPLFLNFWTPDGGAWGGGFNDSNMPWYLDYDWVEVWDHYASTGGFTWNFDDQFTGANGSKPNPAHWNLSNGWG